MTFIEDKSKISFRNIV